MSLITELVWLLLYLYVLCQCGEINKGLSRMAVLFITCTSFLLLFSLLRFDAVWLVITILVVLFDCFYNEEPFILHWSYVLAPGGFLIIGKWLFASILYFQETEITILFLGFCLLLLMRKRTGKRVVYYLMISLVFIGMFAILRVSNKFQAIENKTTIVEFLNFFKISITGLAIFIFLLIETTFTGFKKGFERDTGKFRNEVLQNQYEEVKNVYLNMRGWRHDYHNHLQVIKAHLAFEQTEELGIYLNELEQELNRVDAYIKSGNIMLDAILNSKFSIMEKKKIIISCKTELSGVIPLPEVDLCVILGNLLDNAMEACEQLQQQERFIRVYIAVIKKQFYVSVQNSAKLVPNFNEKNYISEKRGNHGLGIKRVKALTEKYEGFLNLQNEPGIFAAEVTLPLNNIK